MTDENTGSLPTWPVEAFFYETEKNNFLLFWWCIFPHGAYVHFSLSINLKECTWDDAMTWIIMRKFPVFTWRKMTTLILEQCKIDLYYYKFRTSWKSSLQYEKWVNRTCFATILFHFVSFTTNETIRDLIINDDDQ